MGKVKKTRTKSRFDNDASSSGVLSNDEIQATNAGSGADDSGSGDESTAGEGAGLAAPGVEGSSAGVGIVLGPDQLFDDSHVDAFGAPLPAGPHGALSASGGVGGHGDSDATGAGSAGGDAFASALSSSASVASGSSQSDSGILSLWGLLSSHEGSEREYACGGFANIVLEPQGFEAIQKHPDIISALVRCLADPVVDVRPEAAGAIRNICLMGGPEFCSQLVHMGIMDTLISTAVSTSELLASNLASLNHHNLQTQLLDEAQLQEVRITFELLSELLEHVVNSVWLLCENSEDALNIFNSSPLLVVLIQCISSYPQIPAGLCSVAAQCLQTVSEDNQQSLNVVSQDSQLVSSLLNTLVLLEGESLENGSSLLLRVTLSGVLFNLRLAWPAEQYAFALEKVLRALLLSLTVDSPAAVNTVVPLLSAVAAYNPASVVHAAQGLPTHNTKFKNVQTLLNAQQSALEILTNICSVDTSSDDGVWEDVGGGDQDDDMDAPDLVNPEPTASEGGQLQLPLEIVTLLTNLGIPAKVYSLCAVAPAGIVQILAAHKVGQPLLKTMITIQTRALSCLANMLGAIDLPTLLSAVGVEAPQVWQALLEQHANIAYFANYGDDELFEGLTLALWAFMRAVRQNGPNAVLGTSQEQLQRLYMLGKSSASEDVRVNVSGIIGVLASLPEQSGILTDIALGLLDVIHSDPSLLVASEALNSIFDAYAEPNVNQSFVQANMLAQLQQILPAFKQKIRVQKAQLPPDVYSRADETRINLVRFIKYKKLQFS